MAESDASPLLTLAVEMEGKNAVVLCTGRLTSNTTAVLHTPVAELIAAHDEVVLDLAGLTHMDSMGMGELVRLYVSARSKGHVLELRNLGKKVRDLLILTNLISVFSVAGEHGMGIH